MTTNTTHFSVNLNKVATVRNTRPQGIPSITRAATLCLQAGAAGITVHPRPDERHIRRQDVFDLAQLLKAWPQAELNIEGNPLHNLMDLIRELRTAGLCPSQVTFVPDSLTQSTSDHGWQLPQDSAKLTPLIAECASYGIRVSLFMDPSPGAMQLARDCGADRVELYTERYARAFGTPLEASVLAEFRAAALAATATGLGINAGHDLSTANITAFLAVVPNVLEVSIGHAFVADALELGYAQAVAAFLNAIAAARLL